MNRKPIEANDQQILDAMKVIDVASLNAVAALASFMRRRGLLSDSEVDQLHQVILHPLSAPYAADNPIVQEFQVGVDRIISVLANDR